MTTTVPPSLLTSGPAFSAYRATDQTGMSSATWTKVQLNTETFDTAGAFDNATNYRFAPLVSGYYQINGSVQSAGASSVVALGAAIYKNGTAVATSYAPIAGSSVMAVSAVVFLNGSTDYVELWGHINGTGALSFTGGAGVTQMSGVLIQA